VESFDLAHVSHNPAVFDTQKLEWMNNHYIQSLDEDDLAARCVPFLTAEGLSVEPALLRRAIPLIRERMKTLSEAPALLRFLFTDDVGPNEKAAELIAKTPEGYLKKAAEALDALEGWDTEQIQAALDRLASEEGLSRTKGWQPIRAAVTGSNVSPPLPESLALLGKERTVAQLREVAG
jgi:glutamyl-tRNA synthetase